MLYHILPRFTDVHIIFNVFNYLTFRSAGAVVTSLLLAFAAGSGHDPLASVGASRPGRSD